MTSKAGFAMETPNLYQLCPETINLLISLSDEDLKQGIYLTHIQLPDLARLLSFKICSFIGYIYIIIL